MPFEKKKKIEGALLYPVFPPAVWNVDKMAGVEAFLGFMSGLRSESCAQYNHTIEQA